MEIHEFIKSALRSKKIQHKDFAEELGISPGKLSTWLTGRVSIPLSYIVPISKFFGMSVEDLLNPSVSEDATMISASSIEAISLFSKAKEIKSFFEDDIPASNYIRLPLGLLSNFFGVNDLSSVFALIAPDNSMSGDKISIGDMIICKKTQQRLDGKIITAIYKDDLIIRRALVSSPNKIKLLPSDPRYDELSIDLEQEELFIFGQLVGVMSRKE